MVTFGLANDASTFFTRYDLYGNHSTPEEQTAAGINLVISAIPGIGAEEGTASRLGTDVGEGLAGIGSKEGFVGGCFVAGTLVAIADGFQEIQKIKVGDQVWSYNNTSEEWELRPVEATFIHPFAGDIVTVEIGDEMFVASGNHPVWVTDGEALENRPDALDVPKSERDNGGDGRWVEARSLQVGDLLLSQGGHDVKVTRVESQVGKTQVYNIRVQHDHTYAITRHAILVHNKAAQIAPIPVAEDSVTLFHGSRNGIDGGELNFDTSISRRSATHMTPPTERAIYLTDDAARAAQQYGTPAGQVARTTVPRSVADAIRQTDKFGRVEYKVTDQKTLNIINQNLQIKSQRQAIIDWILGGNK